MFGRSLNALCVGVIRNMKAFTVQSPFRFVEVMYETALHHRMTGVRRNQVSVVSCSSTN